MREDTRVGHGYHRPRDVNTYEALVASGGVNAERRPTTPPESSGRLSAAGARWANVDSSSGCASLASYAMCMDGSYLDA
jgi:hypothetical protein